MKYADMIGLDKILKKHSKIFRRRPKVLVSSEIIRRFS
jgi:hypothetical protein